jgi:hypothetical protein
MKELKQITTESIELTTPDSRQVKYLGRIKRGDGHTIWEYNIAQDKIVKAQYKSSNIEILVNKEVEFDINRNIYVKPNCLYCSALNHRNAQRQFDKQIRVIKAHMINI